MITVTLIGGGNVAWQLAHVFSNSEGIELVQMYNKTLENIEYFADITTITDDIKTLKKADIYIIAVSDKAIENVAKNLAVNGLIVHTSGTTEMEVLNSHQRIGVFYPLQTFTKNHWVDFSEIPICIEVNNETDLNLLKKIASIISRNVFEYNSLERKKIHLAAVFVNNFVNHLYYLGYHFLNENAINPKILFPLIKETALKLQEENPYDNQTGPAKRKDIRTFEAHLELLEDSKMKEIYNLLSNSIAETYGEKL